jgi:hypothetical protein
MPSAPIIHRYPEQREGAFVNAYLVETAAGVVAIDSLLIVSESRALRAAAQRLGKPLRLESAPRVSADDTIKAARKKKPRKRAAGQ